MAASPKSAHWQGGVEFDIVGFIVNFLLSQGFFVFGVTLLAMGCDRSRGPMAAQVGGSAITVADFKTRLQQTPPSYQQYAASPEGRRQFLNLLIREKAVYVEARRAGMQRDADYRKAVDQFKAKWQRQLKDFKESLLIDMYLARLRSKELAVSDADVQRYYDMHLADYAKPVEIRASHILLTTPQDAEKALARLKNGEPFAIVARQMSMDPATAARGGALDPFQKGMLVPEFEEAAARLRPGEISGVVKTSFGYHIIRKASQRTLPSRSFDQSKDEIRKRLEREKFDQWVTAAQATLGVKTDENATAALLMAPSPGAPTPLQEAVQ